MLLSNKLPTLLLHGFMGTSLAHFGKVLRCWYGQFPLVCIDLPGHGRSNLNAQDNYYAHAIDYVLDKLTKYKKVNLIGLSYLGGTIALKIAQQHPELVERLVLSGFAYDIPEQAFCTWASNFRLLIENHPELSSEYERLHGNRWQETMQRVIQNIHNSYESLIKTSSQQLKQLQLPVLLINGDHKDNEVMAAVNFTQLSENFQSAVIKGAGHIVTFDQPLEFSHNAKKFLYEA